MLKGFRLGGFCLFVGLLGGSGLSANATPSNSTITLCASKTTAALRYAWNGVCRASETSVEFNVEGPAGPRGPRGPQGFTGEQGDTGPQGERGLRGLTGDTGPQGDTGLQGERGLRGLTGDTGPQGEVGPPGASSPTGFTARSVCGVSGTALCAVGTQGPGGGLIFYVDTNNDIPGFDYLEAAPTEASTGVVWATTVTKCGLSANTNCRSSYIYDIGDALNYTRLGWGLAASTSIVVRHEAGGVASSEYAAGVAMNYSTLTASDWWLPNKSELGLMYTNLKLSGLGSFTGNYYWTSSEPDGSNAWAQAFNDGSVNANIGRSLSAYVRPIRGF